MEFKISDSDLKKLSTNRAVKYLLSSDPIDVESTIRKLRYDEELRLLQIDLIKMQNWIVDHDERLIIILEGAEFSGKGSVINGFTEHLNPRNYRKVALPKPSPIEARQWYFQRYVVQLPQPGEIVFFDRSWYNRAVVEPVNGFCTKKEYEQFMNEVNDFESMLNNDGIRIIKYFLSISKSKQQERISKIQKNPLRRWELSKVDLDAQKLWSKYRSYHRALFERTSTEKVPWVIIDSNDHLSANLNAMRHLLSVVPFRKPAGKK